jgi:hypothetical protein
LKKNKIILSSLILTGVISCSAYRPLVFTDAYLNPESTTEVDYDDLNFSYSLFNQYASGLSYEIVMNYPTPFTFVLNNSIYYVDANGNYIAFTEWDTVGATQATAILSPLWESRLKQVFFDRSFDRTTKKANLLPRLELYRRAFDFVSFEINIISKINYNVNIGSLFMAFRSRNLASSLDAFNMFITFYDRNDNVLQLVLLDTDTTDIYRNREYGLSTIITNVRSFKLEYQWIDIPPFSTGNVIFEIHELNLFTQQSEISIPNDVEGNLFGFEFVAVEWWNILGHLQNFAWWIINQSPLRPLFEWLDTYIISWIRSFIDILTGVFNL